MPGLLPPRAAFYLLFTLSGFAGLIYESIWTHYLKLYLGHAAYAQSLVLAVFMGGMAVGAAACARLSARVRNPLAGYALAEAVIGVAALGFHEAFVALTEWSYGSLLPALGGDASVLVAKLALACLLILPQSVLLGATFPLMSAGLVRAFPQASGESVSMLYFTNSLGAALGVLASGFLLIAWVGLPGTLRTAGVINLGLAAAVWLLARPMRAPAIAPARIGKRAPAGCCSRWRCSPGSPRSSTRSPGSACCRSCWVARRTPSNSCSQRSSSGSHWVALRASGADEIADTVKLLGWVQVAMGVLPQSPRSRLLGSLRAGWHR
jgi:MFS family permease